MLVARKQILGPEVGRRACAVYITELSFTLLGLVRSTL